MSKHPFQSLFLGYFIASFQRRLLIYHGYELRSIPKLENYFFLFMKHFINHLYIH
jgi:hypothetical protein